VSLKTIINGIDVGRQRAAAAAGSLSDRADLATSTEWLGGTQTRTLVATAARHGSGREFTIDADYPDAFLGSGIAPSPHELLFAALGSSFVTSFVLAAAAADVRIEFMRVHTARAAVVGSGASGELPLGDLELHGEVDADASPAHLEQLVAIAIERSLVVALRRLNIRVHLERVDRTPT
jgi:uncharacterized OsmC-like protein